MLICNPEAPAEGLHLFSPEREVFMDYNYLRRFRQGIYTLEESDKIVFISEYGSDFSNIFISICDGDNK